MGKSETLEYAFAVTNLAQQVEGSEDIFIDPVTRKLVEEELKGREDKVGAILIGLAESLRRRFPSRRYPAASSYLFVAQLISSDDVIVKDIEDEDKRRLLDESLYLREYDLKRLLELGQSSLLSSGVIITYEFQLRDVRKIRSQIWATTDTLKAERET